MISVQKIADYEICGPLGAGPLGTVYKAYDHENGREIALRIMSPDTVRWDSDLRSRFKDEGRAIAALRHPNIAEWYKVGEQGDSMYVAAELLTGPDLKRFIAQGTALAVEKKIAVMHQVASALAHAHEAGILHRDIRPANIFVQRDGTAKIADFGLASMTAGSLVKAAVRWGTPLYLCPEQIRRKSYDARSEIFAAGTVFYELLTGVHPFQNSNSNRVLDNIASEEHLPPFEPLSDAPAGLCSIVATCLAKDPADRYANMAELEGALAELVDDVEKECQAMLVELQIATHRLKRAAAVQDAPAEIGDLGRNIRQLLTSDHRRDYASLDRLMVSLAEQSALIHTLTKSPARRQSTIRPLSPPKPDGAESDRPSPPVVGSPEAPECTPPEAPEQVESPEACVPEPVAELTNSTTEREQLEQLDAGELEYLQVMMAEIGPPPSAPEPVEPAAAAAAPPPQEPQPIAGSQELALCPVVAPPPLRRKRIRARVLFAQAAALVGIFVALGLMWQYRVALTGLVRSPLPSAAAPDRTLPVPKPEPLAGGGQSPIPFEPAADVLIREARLMAEQGRPEASRVFLVRALDLEPGNDAARTLLAELDQKEKEQPPRAEDPLRRQISATANLIAAGQLRKARAEIARLAAANPDHPALPALRKNLQAKTTEAGRDATRKAEQAESARRTVVDEESWSKRAGDLFRSGKYAELSRALDQWGAENPTSAQLPVVRAQAAQVQQSLASCQSALNARRYSDAAAALARVEALNPSDPALTELRRMLESRKGAATARVTVLRLAEAGAVLLDGAPVGHAGEVQDAPVAIGEHVLSVKLPGIPTFSAAHDFSEGENVSFVYDGTAIRLMGASDVQTSASRKAREQTHRFLVEHPHGLLRGGCKGELLINGFEVRYRTEGGGPHGFMVPFARLKMKVEGRAVEFRFASDNSGLQSFRIRDAAEAEDLKQLWAKLQKE